MSKTLPVSKDATEEKPKIADVVTTLFANRAKRLKREKKIREMADEMRFIRDKRFDRANDALAFESDQRARFGISQDTSFKNLPEELKERIYEYALDHEA